MKLGYNGVGWWSEAVWKGTGRTQHYNAVQFLFNMWGEALPLAVRYRYVRY